MTQIEAIRKRTGMYIGSRTIRGLVASLEYFFDDVFENKLGEVEIIVEFGENNWIDLKAHNIDTDFFIQIIRSLETESRFKNFGLPIIIALSEQSEIKITNKASLFLLTSTKGNYEFRLNPAQSNVANIEVKFKVDNEVFSDLYIDYDIMNHFIKKYALINNGSKLVSIDTRTAITQVNLFHYPQGLSHLLDLKIAEDIYNTLFFRLDINKKIEEYDFQICFCYNTKENIITYANSDELIYGGSLEQGVLGGIRLALKTLAAKRGIEIDARKIKKQLLLIAVIKGNNLVFYGATKRKLDMPKVKKDVKKIVFEQIMAYLKDNTDLENQFLNQHRKEDD